MSKGLFIVGTGTDVGKTYVTGLLCKKLEELGVRHAYYKAAMSGNPLDENGNPIPMDAKKVRDMSGMKQPLADMCPYVYEIAVSPHLASKAENKPIDPGVVMQGYCKLQKKYDYITAEGSGGILCPICFDEPSGEIWLEDIIKMFNMPALLIADAGLGTINSVVLTVSYMRSIGISIKGIIFNHYHKGDMMEEDNIKMVEHKTGIRVIACVEDDASDIELDGNKLLELYE